MWWMIAAALAAVPDTVRPVVAPMDAPAQFTAWAATKGRSGVNLACDDLWSGQLLLCFRVWEGHGRRWVDSEDLQRWQVDLPALRATIAARARTHLSSVEQVPVQGMNTHYLRHTDGDGWAAAGALNPDALAARLGGAPVLVALPSDGVLVAWKPGVAEVDQVMAVGVREMFDAQQGPLSPMVYRWTGAQWTPFGEATPAGR